MYKRQVVALSAGTAAVHLALLACGVGQGDEVIVQSFTFCASSHPVTYLGAVPVFVDSEKETWNMSPEMLEEAIKDRIAKTGKKPKAIVPVALYGMPYDLSLIHIYSVAELSFLLISSILVIVFAFAKNLEYSQEGGQHCL